MRTKVQKWGNSLAIRIPRGFADELGVRQGGEVELVLGGDGLLVKPAPEKYRLADLLDRVTDSNLHHEVPTGEPQGQEAW